MKFKILTLADLMLWKEEIAEIGGKCNDVFFTPEYYKIFEGTNQARSCCFIFEDKGKKIIYPFLLYPIAGLGYTCEKPLFDITGPHGYNGAVANTEDKEFIDSFNECFTQYCNENNIIAEFVRFHPVFQNEKYFTRTQNSKANKNIVVDLHVNDLFSSYEYSVRKNIKKAIRSGLTVKRYQGKQITDEILNQFYDIYCKTLSRNSAGQNSVFQFSFFSSLVQSVCDQSCIFFTYYDTVPVSTELVLWGTSVGYSYLGGTLSEYFHLRPNEILKFELMKFLKQNGLQYFLLGGGKEINDGIYNYKANFARDGILDFWIGKKIYNEAAYTSLIDQWEAKSNQDKIDQYRNYFYRYRI